MTTTATVGEYDIEVLRILLQELNAEGRKDEASAVARVHAIICEIVYADLLDPLDENDEELAAALEEAERDFAEGRGIPHEEVLRRLAEIESTEGLDG
jgi:hypothetical protein